jgi:hypothetical protein
MRSSHLDMSLQSNNSHEIYQQSSKFLFPKLFSASDHLTLLYVMHSVMHQLRSAQLFSYQHIPVSPYDICLNVAICLRHCFNIIFYVKSS